MQSLCPECEATVNVEGMQRGELVSCPDCGAPLEIISATPVKLEVVAPDLEDFGE